MAKQRPRLRELEPNREVVMDGQQKVKLVTIESLRTQSLFADLFVMHPQVLEEITRSMQTSGFDMARPIVVNEELIVIEGHTRLEAAKRAELAYVPIIVKPFPSDEEALYYALREQTARRNLTPQELIQAVHQLDQLYGEGKAAAGDGRRLDRLASELGVGASTIAKARYLQKHLPKDPSGKIEQPMKSIHASYQELKRQEQHLLDEILPPTQEADTSLRTALRIERQTDGSCRFYQGDEVLVTLHASGHYDQEALLKVISQKLGLDC